MALRSEDLAPGESRVYRFPVERARARARRAARRARFRRTLAAAAVVTVVAGTLIGGLARGSTAPEAQPRRAVVVGPGDTLWDVAERFAPDGVDPRAYVDALVRLNHLDGGSVQAGARLRLPR